jgi:2-methylcitrate dehydratase
MKCPLTIPTFVLRLTKRSRTWRDYVKSYEITSPEAYRMARYCSHRFARMRGGISHFPECVKLLGPIMPGTLYHNGVKVPGTRFELDPVTAAFNISVMIRWLDFSDGFTRPRAAPSDNIGAYSPRLTISPQAHG